MSWNHVWLRVQTVFATVAWAFVLVAPVARAQSSGTLRDLEGLQRQARVIVSLRESETVRQYYQTHAIAYQAWMSERRERATARTIDTPESPSVTTLESLIQEASRIDFSACEARLRLLDHTPEAVFECARSVESFLGNSYRFLELKRAPMSGHVDLRPVLEVLRSSSPTSDEVQKACRLLNKSGESLNCKKFEQNSDLQRAWENLFSVRVRNLRFEWKNGVLKIPMSQHDPEAFELMSRAIELYWNSTPGVRIQLEARDGGVRMIRRAGALAAADELGGYRIQWDPTVDRGEVVRSLAHELGHLIGFADAYVNFWDSELQGVVYYELDRTNLMSSHGGSILPLHWEAIQHAYGSTR